MKQFWRLAVVAVTVLCAVVWASVPVSAAPLNLHRGSHGPRVKTVESRLYALHLLGRGQVDRRYKRPTARAVRTFQRQQGLKVTGRVNTRTWDLIAAAAYRQAHPPKPRPVAAPAPTILGHRGARVPGIPENTMESMAYAADKADVLEFDLRVTSDHQLVLLHDGSLGTTTTCTQNVNAVTLAYLQATCRTKVGGKQVPTFAQVAQYARSIGKAIAPEIKVTLNPTDLGTFVSTVQGNQLSGYTYVQSFDPAVFPRLRELDSDLTFVFLTEATTSPASVQATGATIAGTSIPNLTAERVAAFRAAGLRVWAWTASNTTQLKSLWDIRVNGVFTDIPDSARQMYHPG